MLDAPALPKTDGRSRSGPRQLFLISGRCGRLANRIVLFANFIALAVFLTFLLGIMIVLLYAMIRHHFGPGPPTAIVAALIVWFCVYVYAGILSGALFAIPIHLLALGIVWGLVEYSFGAVLGAWVYKEA